MDNEKNFDSLIEQFNSNTLPKSEWTHSAHLIVGLWHITTCDFSDAVCQLRSKIISLNKFHGTVNDGQSGYHETLTVFWLKVMHEHIKHNPSYSFGESVTTFLNSPLASREYPFEFYKKEDLLSSDYRAVYHEPTFKVSGLST
ncbi:MAG: hypothetical protein K0R51_2856 [Cytophagaceae bacterium]|nr:hypothetical protein [Cytophagaceae bacterium]